MPPEPALVAVSFARGEDVRLVSDFLTECGYAVAPCTDRSPPPASVDLVILDSRVARSVAWVQEVKRQSETFLPVLVGLAGRDRADPWLEAGYDACLRMPFSKAELHANVALLLRLRRQSQELLRRGMERYLAVFEATGTASLVVQADSTILMANRQCEAVTGYAPEEIVGTPWMRYVDPEKLDLMRQNFRKRFESPQDSIPSYETCLIHKNGQKIHVLLSAGRIPEMPQVIVSMVDITQLRRTQEELAKSETLFRDLFLKHSAVKFILDPDDGRILDANEAAEAFYGWSRDRLRSMRISQINTLSQEEVKAEMEKARRGQRGYFEFQHRRADGSVRDVAVYSSRIDAQGKTLLHSIIHDITDRRQAQSRNEMLFTAIEHSSESVVITDVAGTIQYVNPAFCQVTGYTREEAIGQNPRILKSGQHDEAFYQELWSTLLAGRTWRGRFVNRRKDGSFYTEDAAISPVRDEDGRVVGYVAVKRDVTQLLLAEREQAMLQEQLRQSQRLEALGRLAGGVAHDFNNILGVILGYGEMLGATFSDADPRRADLEEILESARRASDLTRQLLAFSRQQPVSFSPLVLDEVAAGMERMLRRLLGEDVELELDLKSAPARVMADRGQLEQVIMNLALNARDAMPNGGRLRISTRQVRPEESNDGFPQDAAGPHVRLAVSDTGYGMTPEVRARLFEPFFTTKEVGKGTGLGLAMVYGIVTRSAGHIHVDSEPGRGTTMIIDWPQTMQDSVGMGVKSEPCATSHSPVCRVLVVEDEDSLRRLVVRVLEKSGFHIRSAARGEDAIALVEQGDFIPDVLLTDVVMPGISGAETARRIQGRLPLVQVVFMSGYLKDHPVQAQLGENAHFLQKPFHPEELVRMVLAAARIQKNQG